MESHNPQEHITIDGLTFINNILYGTVEQDYYGMRCLYIADASTVSRLGNNLYFQEDAGQYIVYTDGRGYHMAKWDAYRQATGWDGRSPTPANPLSVDPENRDFRLQAGSPAIDAGISVDGRTGDYAGKPLLGTPDIGALEAQE
jgi:hypothetical protein